MTNKDYLLRDDGKKFFYVDNISHWCSIRAEDGEEDDVKCYGGKNGQSLYVSRVKGFGYTLIEGT